jgi:hypothetical protein
MWRSGAARRRQQAAVNEMVSAATHAEDYTEPWCSTPAVWEHFHDEAEILRHLQQTWRNALAGAVYIAIERGQGELTDDVTRAFAATCRRHVGVRQILEAHEDHPAIAAAMKKERSLLACLVAGLAGHDQGDLTAA